MWVKAYMPGTIFRWNPGWFEENWPTVWGGMWGRNWCCANTAVLPNFQQWLVPGATNPLFVPFYTNWY